MPRCFTNDFSSPSIVKQLIFQLQTSQQNLKQPLKKGGKREERQFLEVSGFLGQIWLIFGKTTPVFIVGPGHVE